MWCVLSGFVIGSIFPSTVALKRNIGQYEMKPPTAQMSKIMKILLLTRLGFSSFLMARTQNHNELAEFRFIMKASDSTYWYRSEVMKILWFKWWGFSSFLMARTQNIASMLFWGSLIKNGPVAQLVRASVLYDAQAPCLCLLPLWGESG